MTSPDSPGTTTWRLDDLPNLLNHKVSGAEVTLLYEIVLGRPPESEAVIDFHVSSQATIGEFLRTLLHSPEALDRAGPHLVRRIDVEATPDQMHRLTEHLESVWSEYGDTEPFWSVLTDESYRADRITGAEETFYATGAADVAAMVAIAEQYGLELPVTGTVLEVGCGVGRVAEHLSSQFASYIGVDISKPHLKIAADRLAGLGRVNVDFMTLADYLDGEVAYDAVYSVIALQHSPPPVIAHVLHRMLATLRCGGIGVFQVPCAAGSYGFDLEEYLDSRESASTMEMHAIPAYVIEEIAEAAGCLLVVALDDGRVVPNALSRVFVTQKR